MLLQVGEIMAKVHFRVEGMEELRKSLQRLGKVPQKHVTSASRKGMNIVLKQAKGNAPVGDTGNLKKGIVLRGEKSRYKGKKVYRIVFDPTMNDVFQKPIKNPGSRGGQGKSTAYYPISQEYGYFAGDGNYIPGYRFIHGALVQNVQRVEKTIVDEMKKRIDAEIAKVGLK